MKGVGVGVQVGVGVRVGAGSVAGACTEKLVLGWLKGFGLSFKWRDLYSSEKSKIYFII